MEGIVLLFYALLMFLGFVIIVFWPFLIVGASLLFFALTYKIKRFIIRFSIVQVILLIIFLILKLIVELVENLPNAPNSSTSNDETSLFPILMVNFVYITLNEFFVFLSKFLSETYPKKTLKHIRIGIFITLLLFILITYLFYIVPLGIFN